MGHYDSCYEYDERQKTIRKQKEYIEERNRKLSELFLELCDISGNCNEFICDKEDCLDSKLKMRIYDIEKVMRKIFEIL
jgi:hypothetical protein